jgi:peptide/nickel transport system substrate-binding protein
LNAWAKVAALALATVLVGAACNAATQSTTPASAAPSQASSGAPSAAASQPTAGGNEIDTLTWAGKNSIGSLDPALSYDSGTNNYATYAECEALLRFDENTQLQPLLATAYTQVDDTTFTVDLNPAAKFWDGNPVTPDDVIYSLTRVNDPALASPLAGLAGVVDNVTKTGDNQVQIKLNQADPPFRFKLATPMAQIIEKSFAEAAGANFGTAPDKVMCTGPFKPSQWDKGSKLVFDRFDGYWDAARLPKVKQFILQEVTASATLVAGLKSGSIDGTFDLDGRNAQQLEGDANLSVTAGPGNQFNYISPVLLQGPFSDARVRKALSLAIDRTGLANAVSGRYAQPLKAPAPPGLSAWKTDTFDAAYAALATPLTPDLEQAKALIAEASAEGLKAEVIVQESPTADIVGPAIQQAGASIGLDISIKKLPTADWAAANFSGIEPRPFDSMLNFWAADYPDLSADIVIPFSNQYSNVEGWDDPAYRALEDAWTKTAPDSDEQAKALTDMLQMLVDQTVKIPLYVDPTVQTQSSKIGGYTQTKFWFYQNFAQAISGN